MAFFSTISMKASVQTWGDAGMLGGPPPPPIRSAFGSFRMGLQGGCIRRMFWRSGEFDVKRASGLELLNNPSSSPGQVNSHKNPQTREHHRKYEQYHFLCGPGHVIQTMHSQVCHCQLVPPAPLAPLVRGQAQEAGLLSLSDGVRKKQRERTKGLSKGGSPRGALQG